LGLLRSFEPVPARARFAAVSTIARPSAVASRWSRSRRAAPLEPVPQGGAVTVPVRVGGVVGCLPCRLSLQTGGPQSQRRDVGRGDGGQQPAPGGGPRRHQNPDRTRHREAAQAGEHTGCGHQPGHRPPRPRPPTPRPPAPTTPARSAVPASTPPRPNCGGCRRRSAAGPASGPRRTSRRRLRPPYPAPPRRRTVAG